MELQIYQGAKNKIYTLTSTLKRWTGDLGWGDGSFKTTLIYTITNNLLLPRSLNQRV